MEIRASSGQCSWSHLPLHILLWRRPIEIHLFECCAPPKHIVKINPSTTIWRTGPIWDLIRLQYFNSHEEVYRAAKMAGGNRLGPLFTVLSLLPYEYIAWSAIWQRETEPSAGSEQAGASVSDFRTHKRVLCLQRTKFELFFYRNTRGQTEFVSRCHSYLNMRCSFGTG